MKRDNKESATQQKARTEKKTAEQLKSDTPHRLATHHPAARHNEHKEKTKPYAVHNKETEHAAIEDNKQHSEPIHYNDSYLSGVHDQSPNDLFELVKQPFYELEKHARIANERIKSLVGGLPKEAIIDRLNRLELSDKHLNFLIEGIALEREDDDISIAIEEIRKARPVNMTDDPLDHMNYTAY